MFKNNKMPKISKKRRIGVLNQYFKLAYKTIKVNSKTPSLVKTSNLLMLDRTPIYRALGRFRPNTIYLLVFIK